MQRARVAVIGAGVAGLATALTLAARGYDVVVVEKSAAPGGKMRELDVAGARIDAGPTVFTMRWVFEEIFAEAGATLEEELPLRPAEVLARHAWAGGGTLDLYADLDRSVAAIAALAGPQEAERYRAFCARCARIFDALDEPFLRSPRPGGPISLAFRAGLRGIPGLLAGAPFSSLWRELGRHFHDSRLRQLFARYATYCGSSPFHAPAILMLIAHVERLGVSYVEGGMQRLPEAMARLAIRHGAAFRYGAEATEIMVRNGRVVGLWLASGERIDADAVVVNADVAAVAAGLFGPAAASALSPSRAGRSLSALTWAVLAETDGFPLLRHNVFFSDDYAAEFDDLMRRASVPAAPTVYVCAQDRGDPGDAPPCGPERLLCLVNAPATADSHPLQPSEIEQCETRMFAALTRCGLRVRRRAGAERVTSPTDFARLFPGTGGALYGGASHGWQASFRRPGARTRLPGLYLAGGSAHPGAGVPMAALSGRQAAASVQADLASIKRSVPVAMPGGISTRSATTGNTG